MQIFIDEHNLLIRDIHARSVKISASVYRTYYLRINITFVARYGWIRKERFLYIPEWIKIYIVYIYIYSGIARYFVIRRTTKEHAYLHRYNGIHGRP